MIPCSQNNRPVARHRTKQPPVLTTLGSRTCSALCPALVAILCAGLILSGCVTPLPKHYEVVPSIAYANPQDTTLGRIFQPDLTMHPEQAGVTLLSTGKESFRARVDLAALADKTLDLQYYRWAVDTSGSILAEKVMRAADRGVRVRILIDDINTASSDFKFARMDHHPNIEIRLFNPFRRRGFRLFDFVVDLNRLNHRMHNKAFIADNAVAIMGGRNLGDEYFDVDPVANFRDLDVSLVGPVVQAISDSFDVFWNSEWAIPVNAIVKEEMSAEEFGVSKAKLYQWVADIEEKPYAVAPTREALMAEFITLKNELIWAPCQVLYDSPWKIDTQHDEVTTRLREIGQTQEHELLIEAAYLISGEVGIENARRLNARGVRVRILTNSLATNDVAAAHAGYARYRKDLIRNGIELYELRPTPGADNKKWSLLSTKSRASLHTKVFVVDGETTVVGSYNADPRSRDINTEIVVMIESAELTAQVVEYMTSGIAPQASYRLTLEKGERGFDRLVWTTEEDGKEVRYYSDPEVGFWHRFSTWFISLLPIEEHL